MLRTSTVEKITQDELPELVRIIDELSQSKVRHLIQAQALSARHEEVGEWLVTQTQSWPQDAVAVNQAWQSSKQRLQDELTSDLVSRLAPVAAKMADAEPVAEGELWDQWSSERFTDALSQTALGATEGGWPAAAVKPLRDFSVAQLNTEAEGILRKSVRASLARPGSALQRTLHAGFEKLIYLLPLAALGWIGWHVLSGFYRGTQGVGGFVADGFALNALSLIHI